MLGIPLSLADFLGSLAFSKRKNMDLGWGQDLPKVLAVMDDKYFSPSARNAMAMAGVERWSVPENVTWHGPWRQISAVDEKREKFRFLSGLKRLLYGDDARALPKCSMLLVRDGSFLSPYAYLLPEGARIFASSCL